MTKKIVITKANVETAAATLEAIANTDKTVRQEIAARIKLGKILKRLPTERAAFDAALVALKLRHPKTGKDDKRSATERDIMSRDDRSLCVKACYNARTVNAYLKHQAKVGGKVSSLSGVLSKIASHHRKPKTGGKPQNGKPENQQNDFEKLADKFYADCRKLGITSLDALAMLQNYDSEKNIDADLKMSQAA